MKKPHKKQHKVYEVIFSSHYFYSLKQYGHVLQNTDIQ